MVPTAVSSTTVALRRPARSLERVLAAVSPSAFAMVCHELEDVVHTLDYLFSQYHGSPHIHPPSPKQYVMAWLHVRRLPRQPLPCIILPVTISSVVIFPLLLACFDFFDSPPAFVYRLV